MYRSPLPATLLLTACVDGWCERFSLNCDDYPTARDEIVDADGDVWPADEDCDDGDPAIHPQAEEVCDGVDNDCDGQVDEGTDGQQWWYWDDDGDGYGDPGRAVFVCTPIAGYVDNPDDCDDLDADIHPGAPEVCDDADDDEDCDGFADDEDPEGADEGTQVLYADEDCDGYGDPATAVALCDHAGTDATCYAWRADDCDDLDPDIYPGGAETWYDGVDQNCDGLSDHDADGDGFDVDVDVDCDDANSNYNPEATESCADGRDRNCDGAAPVCLSLADAHAAILGGSDSDYAGYSVAGGADLDGDGATDVVVGAYNANDAGTVYIAPGATPGATSVTALKTALTGLTSGDQAGVSIALPGDVDGDGFADLLVGANLQDGGGYQAGAALVVTGPLSGPGSLGDATTLAGESAGDQAGYATAPAGDVNQDGLDDFLVGAFGNDEGDQNAGIAYLILGPATALDDLGSAHARLVGESGSDRAGRSLAGGGGDVNGDGLDDLLVGADDSGAGRGSAYIVLGPVSGDIDLADAETTLTGPSTGSLAGGAVAMGGDTNGDGLDDVFIGAYYWGSRGAVYVVTGPVSGSCALSTCGTRVSGDELNGRMGRAFAGRIDVNGDGLSDLVTSAYLADSHVGNEGKVFVFYGPITTDTSAPSANVTLSGEVTSGYAGFALSTAGDIDEDGRLDLLIGAPYDSTGAPAAGAAHIFLTSDL